MHSTSNIASASTAAAATGLLSPLEIRGVRLASRIVMSPMCQFSSTEGFANDWHTVHLGSRAVGGAALVYVEGTAVQRDGRITPGDMGLWDDAHVPALANIARIVTQLGAVPGIQIAHAGRKAARHVPWHGNKPLSAQEGAWPIVGPSPIAFEDGGQIPIPLTLQGIEEVITAFGDAARRAVAAGFKVLEIHAGHGYLLHSFLSPVSNQREDEYGGTLDNRMRLLLQVATHVRSVLPDSMPFSVRISATDWIDDGPSWDLGQSVELARRLKAVGVDVVDASSGAVSLRQKIKLGPEYQVPFARRIRAEAGIATAAVGLITEPRQADEIIRRGDADLVYIGRAFLHNPYWGRRAQEELAGEPCWPNQYGAHALRRGMKSDKNK